MYSLPGTLSVDEVAAGIVNVHGNVHVSTHMAHPQYLPSRLISRLAAPSPLFLWEACDDCHGRRREVDAVHTPHPSFLAGSLSLCRRGGGREVHVWKYSQPR